MFLCRCIMKRACAFACCVLLLLLSGCGQSAPLTALPDAGAGSRDEYAFVLSLRPDTKELSVTLTLGFTNCTGDTLDSLVLRTYAGAFASEQTSPCATEELHDKCYPNGFSAGGILVHGAWWNDRVVTTAFDDAARTVLRVRTGDIAPMGRGTLRLQCVLTVPEAAYRFGVSDGIWTFGNALPILAVYERGAWRTDAYCPIGDPFVSDCADYDVTLTVPRGYTVAASALMKTDDGQTYRGSVQGVREFAFAVSDAFFTENAAQDGVLVQCFADSGAEAKRGLAYAKKALRAFSELYGAYPYAQFTLCGTTFPIGGMEYPCAVFVDRDLFVPALADTLERVTAHETAHQWFYGIVGSDQFNQPWQDEALSEYAMLRYYLKTRGRDAYDAMYALYADAPMRERIADGVTPATPVDRFSDLNKYTAVVYGRGAAMLDALDIATGGGMEGFLRAYCRTFAYARASREDFAALLRAHTGQDLSALMMDYLDTYIHP